MTGADVDLTKLPVHLQHGKDGGPYISAAMDFARDPATGWTNVGLRRLMLRGRATTGIDLVAPSDLRNDLSRDAQARRAAADERRGRRPPDRLFRRHHAACRATSSELLGFAARGADAGGQEHHQRPASVPADAEWVIEGYLGEEGYKEPEGPYGEFLGYYGGVKTNPVFHVTAITRRRDALFQTLTIGGADHEPHRHRAALHAAHRGADLARARNRRARAGRRSTRRRRPAASYNVRIAMRQRVPGEARNAIMAAFGSLANVKNVFVVDPDIDIFSDEQMEWALATRFQPDRDFVVASAVPHHSA